MYKMFVRYYKNLLGFTINYLLKNSTGKNCSFYLENKFGARPGGGGTTSLLPRGLQTLKSGTAQEHTIISADCYQL